MTKLILAVAFAATAIWGANFPHPAKPPHSKGAALAANPAANAGLVTPESKALRVVRENAAEIVIDFLLPKYTIDEELAGNAPCQVIHAEGAIETAKPGWPRLPIYSLLAGIPPEGAPTIAILEASTTTLEGRYRLCPAPTPLLDDQPGQPPASLGEQAIPDPQAYQLDRFEPANSVELAQIGFIRSQRVAQAVFKPFQYNPKTGELRATSHLRVRIGLQPSLALLHQASLPVDEGEFEPALQSSLVNYHTARAWRKPAQSPPVQLRMSSLPEGQALRIEVRREGMVRVTYADAQAAGARLDGVDPKTFQLTNQSDEVAILVTGQKDGRFDPGDQILFYAAPIETVYTTTNVYWLHWDNTNGLRMSVQNNAPKDGEPAASYATTQHAEANTRYLSTQPDLDRDKWYWGTITVSSQPASATYTIQLSQVDFTSSYSAKLRGVLKGAGASPQHHTRILLNGHLVDDHFWPSFANYIFEVNIPPSYLQEGANTITVSLPRDSGITSETVLVNWFEIDYHRRFVAENDQIIFETAAQPDALYQISGFSSDQIQAFDITQPNAPQVIAGASVQLGDGSYTLLLQSSYPESRRILALSADGFVTPTLSLKSAPPSLRDPSNGADYLILTHAEFLEEVQPLAAWRAEQGLRVRTIDVQQIYDEFNAGIFDPRAIRDFLAFAYENWQRPAPFYVVLVGDGHYDPRNYLGTNEVNFIPAYLWEVDPWLVETPSDNRYVTVSGDDNLPDMAIGRLPVKTSAEAAAVVAKIVAYEQDPAPGDWNNNVLFVADNSDSAGNFAAYSDLVVNDYLPAGYLPNKIYYPSTHTTPASVQSAILSALNQGRLMVNYVGHGSVFQWATEYFFGTNQMPLVDNAGKLPIVAAMACLNGYFHMPSPSGVDYSSLAEVMVRASQRSAVAFWSSAGMGLASGQDYLDRGLFQAIFLNGETRLGAAVLQSKLFLYGNSPYYPDLIDNFTLFGDPALKVHLRPTDLGLQYTSQPDQIVRSGSPISYTLSYANHSQVYAPRVTITEDAPIAFTTLSISSSPTLLHPAGSAPASWEIGGLLPGQSGTITVTGVVNVDVFAFVTTAADIHTPAPEADPGNNTAGPLSFLVINPDRLLAMSSAKIRPDGVEITWKTNTEIITTHYNLYRSDPGSSKLIRLNAEPIPSQASGSHDGASYTFVDHAASFGQKASYWVEIVHQLGSTMQFVPFVSADHLVYLPLAIR